MLIIPYEIVCSVLIFSLVNEAHIMIRENKIVTLCTNPGYSVFATQYKKHDQKIILEKRLRGPQKFVKMG